jgi:hypothetical protein
MIKLHSQKKFDPSQLKSTIERDLWKNLGTKVDELKKIDQYINFDALEENSWISKQEKIIIKLSG